MTATPEADTHSRAIRPVTRQLTDAELAARRAPYGGRVKNTH